MAEIILEKKSRILGIAKFRELGLL
ncbi:MAG: hypothetical protein PWQ68_1375, partial [Thermoanaerobacteraceae bacterium]|nr:hypothetical protein [Thermoanaerobacteraceae bacterium]